MKGLDFEDERYVRVYTRDTPEWLLLSWEARSLYLQITRKLDRAGVLDLGRHDAPKAVAAVVGIPLDVVAGALPELLAAGLLELRDHYLVDPSFIEAQEAKQNDAARARAFRERRRAGVTKRDDGVRDPSEAANPTPRAADPLPPTPASTLTNRDAASRGVTERHAANENVTPSLAVPCLALPNDQESLDRSKVGEQEGEDETDPWGLAPPKPAEDTQGKAVRDPPQGRRAADPEPRAPKADQASQVRIVFDYWREIRKHPTAKLDPKRRGKIQARLREGFTVEQLCQAIDGVAKSAWHCGDNPAGKVYDDLALVLRDAPHVENFEALGASQPKPGPRPEPPPPRREPPPARPIGEIPVLRRGGPLAALRHQPEAAAPARSRSELLAGLAALDAEPEGDEPAQDAAGGAS